MSPPSFLFRVDLDIVLNSQNPDGGWSYRRGPSWTEPTVYALLALAACRREGDNFRRGLEWLAGLERGDGGWPPAAEVRQSTWVTALVVLLSAGRTAAPKSAAPNWNRGVDWLLRQTGRESGAAHRLRLWLLGHSPELDLAQNGWPWFPGAAAWIAPTALTVLALERAYRYRATPVLAGRIDQGRRFLLSRACRDGGWNHGAARALGRDGPSYPETTGIALLALHALDPSRLSRNLAAAERHLESCRSVEGRSWLAMALRAHGREPSLAGAAPCRTFLDAALAIIAAQGPHLLVA